MVAASAACEKSGGDVEQLQIGQIVDGKWKIREMLGKGACGVVYKVEDRNRRGWFAAMKVEYSSPDYDQTLRLEIGVLTKLKMSRDMLKLIDFGKRKRFTYMVTTLCGKDLMALRCKIKRGFNDSSALRIAVYTLYGLKQTHEAGYIHRDVKPGNIITSAMKGRESKMMMLIDFGMARSFITTDGQGKRHLRQMRRRIPLRGTVRYCSMNVHERLEQGRGDDLIAMMYMLVEVTLGLPWHNLKNEPEVMTMKKNTKESELFDDLPEEFKTIFEYVKTIKYEDRPSYTKVYNCLFTAIKRLQINFLDPYEWEDEEIEKDTKAEKLKEAKEKAEKESKESKDSKASNETTTDTTTKSLDTINASGEKDQAAAAAAKKMQTEPTEEKALKKEKDAATKEDAKQATQEGSDQDKMKACPSVTAVTATTPAREKETPENEKDVDTAIDYDAREFKTYKSLPKEELQFVVFPSAAPCNFGETLIPF